MKAFIIVVAVLAILGGGAALYITSNADKTTSVKSTDIKVAKAPDDDPGLRPAPGKYTYAGTGKESVSILGGGEHTFPKIFTTTVELGAGCEWIYKLYYLEEHRIREVWCTDKTTITQLSYKQTIKFFGSTEKVSFTCKGDILPADAKPGDTVVHTCMDKGRKEVRTIIVGTPTTLDIGGEQVSVTPVKSSAKLTGVTVGTSTSTWWFLKSGLMAKYSTQTNVRSDSVLGETDYMLSTVYMLQGTEPK